MKLLILLSIIFISTTVFSRENMIRYGYQSCLSCHDNVNGGGILTEYGKYISSITNFSKTEYEEGGFKKKIRLNGKMDHAFQFRYASIENEDENAHFPMQVEYINSFLLGKKFKGQIQVTKMPDRQKNILTENKDKNGLYIRKFTLDYKVNKNVIVYGGRDRLPLGLNLEDHTLYFNNENQNKYDDFKTLLNINLLNKTFQLKNYLFTQNGQERELNKESGGGLEHTFFLEHLKNLSFGYNSLLGRTKNLERLLLGGFFKYSPMKKVVFSFVYHHTKRKQIDSKNTFDQNVSFTRVEIFPFDFFNFYIDFETLDRESPFFVKEKKLGLGTRLRLTKNALIQVNMKRSKNDQGIINKNYIGQVFFNVW